MIDVPAGWKVFSETDSTNDTVHDAAVAGAAEGTVHLALRQSRGRGRAGRDWWAPPGGALLMTLLLRPRIPAAETHGLSLIAGRAARDALDPLLDRPLSLYWPNDLYVGPHTRKLGGILCELRHAGPTYWIALGLGVNIDLRNAPVPPELEGRIISLAECGCPETHPVPLAMRIVERFWPLYERFQAGEAVPRLVADDLAHVGSHVTVHALTGPEIRGVVTGLGPHGALLVRDASGTTHEILAGDVVYE